MKKIMILILAVLMCFFSISCSRSQDSSGTENQLSEASTEALAVSTTKKPATDTKKAEELKLTMAKALGTSDESITVQNNGSFKYQPKAYDESKIYSMEYTEEIEKAAYKSIEKYIDSIREYYPDGDEIKLYIKNSKQISYGDNGIDSVYYTAVYINTQNQKITVYADSTGELYYAKCDFTW